MEKTKKLTLAGGIFALFVAILSFVFYEIYHKPPQPPPPLEGTLPQIRPFEITIFIYNGKIVPDYFKVQIGQPISLTVISMEGKHSLRIKGKNYDVVIPELSEAGQTFTTLLPAPSEKGKYQIFCTQKGHQEKGIMVVE